MAEDALTRTLAKLPHLNLTGRVCDSPVMKACGGYCDVFVGHATIPSANEEVMKVAIKRIRIHVHKDEKAAESLARELYIWSKLVHENILKLQGYVLEEGYPSIIAEWMENGTVREYLKNHQSCDLVAMVSGIAEGMKYLHSHDIIHSDLKTDNVLVGSSGQPLICDFGFSRMLSSFSLTVAGATDENLKGTMRWMAPELISSQHTKESDVWAFGMTTYEILTGERPYHHLTNDFQVMFAVARGDTPFRPSTYSNWSTSRRFLWEICEMCLKFSPNDRIPMAQVAAFLDNPRKVDILASEDPAAEEPNVAICPTLEYTSAEMYNSPQHPPMPSVHPLLNDLYHLCLDFSSHAFSPQMVTGNRLSRSYIPLHPGYLVQLATYPPTSEIRIICKEYRRFADSWTITVKPGRQVSVVDVLRATHSMVYKQIKHAEWATLSDKECYDAGNAYTRRCRSAEFEKTKGVRRVDLLGEKHWFGGLKRVKDDDPHDFELHVVEIG